MDRTKFRIDKKEKMFGLLREQSVSNLSVKDFCVVHGLSVATWYYWHKKFHNHQLADNPAGNSFSLLVPQEAIGDNGRLYAEFKGIRFYQEPSASLLKSLIG